MTRFRAAAALTAITMLCTPAFAQAPGTAGAAADHGTPAASKPAMSGSMTPSAPSAAVPGSTAMKGANTMAAATCQSMMDQSMAGMNDMRAGAKKRTAMRHMDMAKSAMNKNNEAGCKAQMQMAMTSMK